MHRTGTGVKLDPNDMYRVYLPEHETFFVCW